MTLHGEPGAVAKASLGHDRVDREAQSPPLVEVVGVSKTYRRKARERLTAVDNVSLAIHSGATLGIVGESGSGKSTLARLVLGLERPDTGRILHDGEDLATLTRRGVKDLRRDMQVVLQNPVGSLNRRKCIEQIIAAPLQIHRSGTRNDQRRRVRTLLDLVGLPEATLTRRPSQLSGGQCQRVSIARALALGPRFIVLDEAVSALDVSIQAQVLNLLKDLQSQLHLSYLFISHDLAVIRHMSTDVAVMYAGSVIEHAPCDELFAAPAHPYTALLMSSLPGVDADISEPTGDTEPLSYSAALQGCRFRARCPVGHELDRCRSVLPALAALAPGHTAACHFPHQHGLLGVPRGR